VGFTLKNFIFDLIFIPFMVLNSLFVAWIFLHIYMAGGELTLYEPSLVIRIVELVLSSLLLLLSVERLVTFFRRISIEKRN